MVEKWKVIFLLCFTFFSWSLVQWQKLSFGANLASP
jgi:hypothetical protein